MVFSSVLFLFYFLPLVLLVYYLIPRKLRNLVLFICSLAFYAWGEPVYVVLMLFSTLVDFFHGYLVDKYKSMGKTKSAKLAVISSMVINLTLLCFFKYADFIIANVNAIFHTSLPSLSLPLPIGISFYTFQTMSYTIDVYRGDAERQTNIIDFGTYVVLFPQLIAGPIVRYKTIAQQLKYRKESVDSFSYGVVRFAIGLGKKVLLANNIGYVWSQISAMPLDKLSVVSAWLGIIAFTFQIYFDFSGYSDMAIGLGKMFGFTFLENFNYPYISRSITEFWRRWHISLSTWFKEYVYIPLGGNRKGFRLQIRNILVVWLLTGIWHGASWNFIAWGLYFGIILILEKLFLLRILERLPGFFRHVYTMVLVVIGWAVFAFDRLTDSLSYINAMFGGSERAFIDTPAKYQLYTNAILIAILVFASTDLPVRLYKKIQSSLGNTQMLMPAFKGIAIGCIILLSVAYLVDASYNPFLYFRF